MTKLINYEDEDIFDVVFKLEKSFGLKFEDDALYNVNTFGEMFDVIISKIQGENLENCSSQQAFYKIRNAISATLLIDKNLITVDTNLNDIFTIETRTQKIKELQDELDIRFDILSIQSWLSSTIFYGIIISLAMFFFKWQIALSGLTLFITMSWIANKFLVKEFEFKTVGQLSDKIVRENYVEIRREKGTINKQEILNIIIDTFNKELYIEKNYLTRNDKFGWAT